QLFKFCDPFVSRQTRIHYTLSTEVQVLVTLRFIASGSFQNVLGDTLAMSKASVCCSTENVITALKNHTSQHIKWPAVREQQSIKEGFYLISGFPNVVGAVDGTYLFTPTWRVEEKYNANRGRTKQVIEQCIGSLKMRFRALHTSGSALQYLPEKCMKIIISTVIG
ncbi:HARB1 nuclease, partial [Polyodon spathula]|nr:HARB1 nuclease [Polyodon spathula]